MDTRNRRQSATKIVLVLLTMGAIGFSILGIDAPDMFWSALMLVYGYYFGRNTSSPLSTERPDKEIGI